MLKDVSIETDGRTSLNFWNQTLGQTGGSEPADEHTEQRAKKEGRRALREEAPHRGRELGLRRAGSESQVNVQLSHRAVRGGSASRDRPDESTERRSMARTALEPSGTVLGTAQPLVQPFREWEPQSARCPCHGRRAPRPEVSGRRLTGHPASCTHRRFAPQGIDACCIAPHALPTSTATCLRSKDFVARMTIQWNRPGESYR